MRPFRTELWQMTELFVSNKPCKATPSEHHCNRFLESNNRDNICINMFAKIICIFKYAGSSVLCFIQFIPIHQQSLCNCLQFSEFQPDIFKQLFVPFYNSCVLFQCYYQKDWQVMNYWLQAETLAKSLDHPSSFPFNYV